MEETLEEPVVRAEDIEEVVDLEDNLKGGTEVAADITTEVEEEAALRAT